MKNWLTSLPSLAALGVLFLAVASVGADETPYLDFIRALRSRNMGDLAIEYLDKLSNDKDTPADIKAVITLERGTTRMEQGANEFNAAKRAKYYDQARAEFAAYIKAKPNDPYAAEAKFESARIVALQGRSQFTRAQRSTEEGAQVGDYQKSLELSVQANRELKVALGQLDEALAKNPPPKVTQALTTAKMRCQLELARTDIDRAACYEPLNKNREEADGFLKSAIAELKKLHAVDAKNPVCWVARTYAGKAYLEKDQSKEAEAEFKAVLSEVGPHVEGAQRLARFFTVMDKIDPRKRKASDNESIVKLGDEWMRLYSGNLNTAEGIVLRFELGKTYEAMGYSLIKDPKAPLDPKAKDYLEKAENIYSALEDLGTEFGDEITNRNLNIKLRKFGNINVTDVKTLVTFDQAYNAMQALAVQLQKTDKPEERKNVLGKILEVLNRATALIDSRVPESKQAEVRGNLAWVYLSLGDPYKAVVIGEYLAHQMPNVPKAAAGGAFALQAYSTMMSDGTADPKWIDTDAARMHKLAVYMEKTWPTDPNTDAARHQVGTLLLRQKKAKEAADVLSRVSDSYKPASARADARWWWFVAAQQMLSEKVTDKEKAAYQEQMFKALESFPEVDNNAPAEVAQMYVMSQLQLGQTFYETKKFDKMEGLSLKLQKRLPNFKNLDDNYKKDLTRSVDGLVFYSQFARANAELQAGRWGEARKIADPVLQRVTAQISVTKKELAEVRDAYGLEETKAKAGVQQAAAKAEELKERLERMSKNVARDEQLQRGLMVVALRAAILDPTGGARAQQLLGSLQVLAKDAKEGESGNVSGSVYIQIVQEMNNQIKELKAGLPGTQATLTQTLKSFTAFLEQIAAKPLTPELIFFLANAYQTLEKYAEAGQLLTKIAQPAAGASDKEQSMYKAAQLMSITNLRKGKQFKEAETLLGKVMKTDWGGKSVQIAEERALLMEDETKWGGAAVAWKDLMGMLLPSITKGSAPPRIKEQYYSAYFSYVNSLYKYAQTQQAPKNQEYIKRAAQVIIKLEETQADFGGENFKEKYMKLLTTEAPLKKEYDALKKANASGQ